MTGDLAVRASCVRCNAVIEVAAFEADWGFARCTCGARSPIPETVRRLRPTSFRGGARRALAHVLAHRPDGVRVTASTEDGALEIRAQNRAMAFWAVLVASLRLRARPHWPTFLSSEPLYAGFDLVIRARSEGGRWALSSSDPHSPDVVLDAPFSAIARDKTIVVRGGHPVHDEWIAATLPAPAHAEWIAEWLGASLHEHAAREDVTDAPRMPVGYRR